MQEKLKMIAKGAMAILTIALGTMLVTRVFDATYDLRLIVAAVGGAFLYHPLVDLFSKIKKLQ